MCSRRGEGGWRGGASSPPRASFLWSAGGPPIRRAVLLIGLLALAFGCEIVEPDAESGRPFEPRDLAPGSVRFIAIGDFGTGGDDQRQLADVMCDLHDDAPFDYAVTTGDNVYPSGEAADFEEKFFEPFACLFDRGVQWHASLGNHDKHTDGGRPEIEEPAFGMPAPYYSWRLGPVRFFMLDSNDLDGRHLVWLAPRLREASSEPWTVVAFHHPVYSGGARYGATPGFADLFVRMFAVNGVDLVLNGHEHIYSRADVAGTTYLVTGGGGAQLYSCVDELPPPVKRCSSTHHFLMIEAGPGKMTATVVTKDGGMIERVDIPPNG